MGKYCHKLCTNLSVKNLLKQIKHLTKYHMRIVPFMAACSSDSMSIFIQFFRDMPTMDKHRQDLRYRNVF